MTRLVRGEKGRKVNRREDLLAGELIGPNAVHEADSMRVEKVGLV